VFTVDDRGREKIAAVNGLIHHRSFTKRLPWQDGTGLLHFIKCAVSWSKKTSLKPPEEDHFFLDIIFVYFL
jgi:hypothetical protein